MILGTKIQIISDIQAICTYLLAAKVQKASLFGVFLLINVYFCPHNITLTPLMEHSFALPDGLTKPQRYEQFIADYAPLIEGETDITAVLANTAAALHEAFGFFWVGFYLVKDSEWLTLGPFQGSVACYRIRRGRGVCGTAWAEGRTIVVPDVDAFPGHIACSSLSRSEIVVPLMSAAGFQGVLDIDSDHLAAFDETDRRGLEHVVQILVCQLYDSAQKAG